jgi:hypothetical protein
MDYLLATHGQTLTNPDRHTGFKRVSTPNGAAFEQERVLVRLAGPEGTALEPREPALGR